MSKIHIACLLSPMANTEGPMDIQNGNALTGSKMIMGKYGEVGLEATITFGEEHPNDVHADLLSVGKAKEVTSIQQTAIAMFQPAKFPGTLAAHALEMDDIQERDAFEVADYLTAMINQLDQRPDLIFAGRESWDYGHGVVGPAVAQKLGIPYYSGVNEIKLNDGYQSVTATFLEGNDKLVYQIPLPAVFGTTDWLNGKDSARFTSLKGVMAAKKFKRNKLSVDALGGVDATKRTTIYQIDLVKSERKNRLLNEGEGSEKAKQAVAILVQEDKVLSLEASTAGNSGTSAEVGNWESATAASLNLSEDVVMIADHDGAQIRLATHQVLSQARKVADATGKKVSLLVFSNQLDSLAASAKGHGADRVIGVAADQLARPSLAGYVSVLNQLMTTPPSYLFTVANDFGRDLAATMASTYGAGLLQDAVSLDVNNGALSGTRIVSNARFRTQESILESTSQVVSIRPSAFDPFEDTRPTQLLKVEVADVSVAATLQERVAGAETKGIPLNEAKIIVSGGRGLKAPDNFKNLEELADLLGGTVGASRAVTDLEWVPHNLQIGQTGTTVAPNVYFAIGISGAIQHLTGMLGSKYIVAVNSDGDAPIHKHADLSIVDKWENVLPQLTQAIRDAKS